MLEKLRDLWRHGKDKGAALVARHQINKRIEDYGEMLRLNIDSSTKAIEMELLLKGEAHPIILFIEEYVIEEDASGLSILIKRISTSREWMTAAAQHFLQGKKFPIPAEYAGVLKLVV
jgi:hypothetical protein